MIKEIKYNGFTASPSDYESPDGELAALIGLVPDEGHLKPILPALTKKIFLDGKKLAFVHKLKDATVNHIVTSADDKTLYFYTLNGTLQEPASFYTLMQSIKQIAALGNILLVLCEDDVHHFMWKDGTYSYYGTGLPVPQMEFELEGQFTRYAHQNVLTLTKKELSSTIFEKQVYSWQVVGAKGYLYADRDAWYAGTLDIWSVRQYPPFVRLRMRGVTLEKGKTYCVKRSGLYSYVNPAGWDPSKGGVTLEISNYAGQWQRLPESDFNSDDDQLVFTAEYDGLCMLYFGGNNMAPPYNCTVTITTTETNIESEYVLEKTQENYNAVMGKANEFIQRAHEQGKFVYPFYVRYALELYDGSIISPSAPCLMIPNDYIAPYCFGYSHQDYKDMYVGANQAKLKYRILNGAMFEAFKDMVKQVVIAVSQPIYTYNQGATTKDNMQIVDASVSNCRGTMYGSVTFDGNTYNGRTSVGQAFLTTINAVSLKQVILPGYNETEQKNLYTNKGTFRIIASLSVDTIINNGSEAFYDVPIKGNALTGFDGFQQLTDATNTLTKYIPRCMYTYNSRINFGNLREIQFRGISLSQMFMHISGNQLTGVTAPNGYVATSGVKLKAIIRYKRNGAVKNIVTEWYDSNSHFFPLYWFFYPKNDAYEAVVFMHVISTGQFYKATITLTMHGLLNGAYFYDANGATWTECSATDSELNIYGDDIYDINPNKVIQSEVNNPFFFPAANTTLVGNESITAFSTAAKALSEGQHGEFPLYVFATDGIWGLAVSNTGTYGSIAPITRDVCINPKSITQLDSSVLFASDRGIMLISGSNTQCISNTLDYEQVFSLSALPSADKLIDAAGLTQQNFNYVTFRTFLKTCRIIYAYVMQRIIVYNPAHRYAYIYSLKTKSWGMMQSDVTDNVPSYPDALAMMSDGTLVDFCENDTSITGDPAEGLQGIKGMLVTRPLKLDAPDLLKTIDTIIQRGNFRKGSIKTALYGSRDLNDWYLVWTSQDHYLRGFRGTPYKYFRIVLLCDMQPEESLFGATIQYTPKLLNQPR